MTIGISKEELIALKEIMPDGNSKLFIHGLIIKCKELNPWLPIDENTPKDSPLLLLTKEYGKQVGYWFETSCGGWWVVACMPVTPTHYQELPEAPK